MLAALAGILALAAILPAAAGPLCALCRRHEPAAARVWNSFRTWSRQSRCRAPALRSLKLRADSMRDRMPKCLGESSLWYTSSGKRLPSTSAIQFSVLQSGRFASAFHRTAFSKSALCGLTDCAVKPFTKGRISEAICGSHRTHTR